MMGSEVDCCIAAFWPVAAFIVVCAVAFVVWCLCRAAASADRKLYTAEEEYERETWLLCDHEGDY